MTHSARMHSVAIDAQAQYWPAFLSPIQADALFQTLTRSYDLNQRQIPMAAGGYHRASTGQFLFADAELINSGALPPVWGPRAPWPETLALIRDQLSSLFHCRFSLARCVYYANGDEAMAYHTDPPALGDTDSIASLSLGASRLFEFRSLTDANDALTLTLQSGDLLWMGPGCQQRYEHALLPRPGCHQPRLNLTFRLFGWSGATAADSTPSG
ncbi:alpha-ketoglutarate-dependent dioxygenase AlkB [Ferrimonas sp. SCSIO 43195]|uniref:alpha-ketoglutarate-dependent dioxygenase AlkB n=1 Tax=Ferrimonas sp. SCSIO 43195 TaxID=2822844 RepID=UPI002074F87C|nr:alpha-ketoglutarate-dependent dioxygenase AlkB [Ferrimonas sp. SCSIO 43195]USD39106.1 alpha-ketoglutarate-dependent dioxygenase AlkB [Ferrimonas sp. SCSIO 43195]